MKRLLSIAAAALAAATMNFHAYAAGISTESSEPAPAKPGHHREATKEDPASHEAHKKEMEQKRAELEEKWNALSKADKEAVYKLKRQQIDLRIKQIKKYQDLGLIESAKADEWIAHLTEAKNNLGKDDALPFGFPGDCQEHSTK